MTPIYFLLQPKTLLLDVIGPAEVFQYANRLLSNKGKKLAFELHFIGPETELQSSLPLAINIQPLPEKIANDAWLLVPGQMGSSIDLDNVPMLKSCQWLNQHKFTKVISVCSGALVLAKAGLLKNKQCTTHHAHIEELSTLLDERQVLENRLFVEDGNVFTSAGITSGIDLALYLVQKYYSPSLATEIAKNMVLFTRRGHQDPSYSPWLEGRNHLHSKVHKVQDAIQADPAKDWSLSELANIAHCSARHLVRLFKATTHLTTKQYIYTLRLALAIQLLQGNQMSIDAIANLCGFQDVRQFRRLWSRHYPKPPSYYRT